MFTEEFCEGLCLSLHGNDLTKEAMWGKLFGGTATAASQKAGKNLWGQVNANMGTAAAKSAIPGAEQAGVGAFGSMVGQGVSAGRQAYGQARQTGAGVWDAARSGFGQGGQSFNNMYHALGEQAQKRVRTIGRNVGYGAMFGGGTLAAGAAV